MIPTFSYIKSIDSVTDFRVAGRLERTAADGYVVFGDAIRSFTASAR